MAESYQALLEKGQKALQSGDTLVALVQFETAYQIEPTPGIKSRLAYCLASERHHMQKALNLCREALTAEPANPEHYYQLGRIYLLAARKNKAIASFRKGLKHRRYQPIIDELRKLGLRKEPVFTSLPRGHFLNRSFGRLMSILGAR